MSECEGSEHACSVSYFKEKAAFCSVVSTTLFFMHNDELVLISLYSPFLLWFWYCVVLVKSDGNYFLSQHPFKSFCKYWDIYFLELVDLS